MKGIKEISKYEEAKAFVDNLHTCRMVDSTWDEYMEIILRLEINK